MKNIVGSNLSLTEDDNNLTITAVDAYNKDEITTKIYTDINKKQNTLSNGLRKMLPALGAGEGERDSSP